MYQKMIDLFIKDTDTSRTKYGNFAGVVGIICNIVLAVTKFTIGILCMSVSIRADAVNNLVDSMTAILSVVSFKIASKPADKKHPFGHARIEYIVSMLLSFFLLLVGVELLKTSINKIICPAVTVYTTPVLIILFLSLLLKVWLSLFYRYVANKINSSVLRATSADAVADVFSTGTVLISAFVSRFTELNLDGYAGVAVSLFLLVNAFKILNETKNHILGTAPDLQLVEQIRDYALSNKMILGVHDICIHNYGPERSFASLHAEVDGEENIFITHDAVDNVERGIFDEFGIQCIIHLDPVITDDEQVSSLRERVQKIVERISPDLSIHDFRLVPGETHSKLIFDILAPFECPLSDSEIKTVTEKQIKEISHNYFAVITVDKGEKI